MGVLDARLRLLYVMKILEEKTDRDHYLNQAQIVEELQKYEEQLRDYKLTSGDRRNIYNDIEALSRFGIDIMKAPSNRGWYVDSRDFEDSEIKLLIDAVRGAKFISDKKTGDLIEKLETLTNKWAAKELHKRTISVEEKNSNNKVMFYTIDAIQEAMKHNSQITFQYVEWTEKKEERFRKNGTFYVVSPWSLIWNNEFYYMLAHDPETGGIKHYRVDRIRNIEVLDDKKREGQDVYQKYHPAFTVKTFGMYGGDDVSVGLRCKNDMAGVIVDRFGHEPIFVPDGEEHFIVNVKVTLSPQFFGWLVAVGNSIEIKYPETLQKEYIKYLKNIIEAY